MELKELIDTMEIKEIIDKIWSNIENDLNNENLIISSEKTIVFYFAWHLNLSKEINTIYFDFEKVLFGENFTDGKFLDLFIKVELQEKIYRIGFEFKFPNKKKSGSGHTQIRPKIINDIKRLNHLIDENKIDLGVFLCATNEKNFIINKQRKKHSEFRVHHGMKYLKGDSYPLDDKFKEDVIVGSEINFQWRNKELITDNYFSFLEPIYLNKKDE